MVWIVGAPVAIAFGGCIGMGAMYNGPCLLISYEPPPAHDLVVLQTIEPLQGDPPFYLPSPISKVLTPPPRPVLFFS